MRRKSTRGGGKTRTGEKTGEGAEKGEHEREEERKEEGDWAVWCCRIAPSKATVVVVISRRQDDGREGGCA